MRYAIWNNKGGVGKTFISFILSTEYANKHPEKTVIVVDMCPQANLSEIILGGNGVGGGNLEKILHEKKRTTIGGYFDERISSPHNPDSHSVTIVCSHTGQPLFKIKPGKYEIHNENPQVNEEPLTRYKTAISKIIEKL